MQTGYIVTCETYSYHKINDEWQYEGCVWNSNDVEKVFLSYEEALEFYNEIETDEEIKNGFKYVTSKYLKSVDIDINNAILLKDCHGNEK